MEVISFSGSNGPNLTLSGVQFDLGGAVLSASLYTNSALNGPLSFNEIRCLLAILNQCNQANLWFTINKEGIT